uniref:(California timema) hypothetical protein n=1 Tax=Timema californicum TaxID=61474 RepID=A0A7R9P7T6_TIMCA|nr:unnamed protein product [Timema californicum]
MSGYPGGTESFLLPVPNFCPGQLTRPVSPLTEETEGGSEEGEGEPGGCGGRRAAVQTSPALRGQFVKTSGSLLRRCYPSSSAQVPFLPAGRLEDCLPPCYRGAKTMAKLIKVLYIQITVTACVMLQGKGYHGDSRLVVSRRRGAFTWHVPLLVDTGGRATGAANTHYASSTLSRERQSAGELVKGKSACQSLLHKVDNLSVGWDCGLGHREAHFPAEGEFTCGGTIHRLAR